MVKITLSLILFFFLGNVIGATGYCERAQTATNSQASILPILELNVFQTGQSELRFGNILPSISSATEAGPLAINLEITSNIGEQYQVIQIINGALTNASGDMIQAEQMRFITVSAKSIGLVVSDPTVVISNSPQIIYTSDSEGNSNAIRIEYRLTVPAAQAPGDYTTRITYTVISV